MSRSVVKLIQDNLFSGDSLTTAGIDFICRYYEKKYPDRGRIFHVEYFDDISSANAGSEDFCKSFTEILRANPACGAFKIVVSSCCDKEKKTLAHSCPVVIAGGKIILPIGGNSSFFADVAQKIDLQIVKPRYDKSYGSFQADNTSCSMIAIALLKDLTEQDLALMAKFESGFEPLAKSLKYAQSPDFLDHFPEQKAKNIKPYGKVPTTLEEYFCKNYVSNFGLGDDSFGFATDDCAAMNPFEDIDLKDDPFDLETDDYAAIDPSYDIDLEGNSAALGDYTIALFQSTKISTKAQFFMSKMKKTILEGDEDEELKEFFEKCLEGKNKKAVKLVDLSATGRSK